MSGGRNFDQVSAELGLPLGRMISLSKSGYHERNPDNAVVFNATIADADGNRLWWGDIDLTEDEVALVELARQAGIAIRLYFEGDSRVGFVTVIDRRTAVVAIAPDGTVTLGGRWPLTRDQRGRITRERALATPVEHEPQGKANA